MDSFQKYYYDFDLCIHLNLDKLDSEKNFNNFEEFNDVLDNQIHNYQLNTSLLHNKTLSKLDYVLYNFIHKYKLNNITVSLSGGIDSMVSIFVLKKLKNRLKEKFNFELNLNAFHLIYGNRKESFNEFLMIEKYCQILDVKLYSFEIKGITRKFTNREFYEKITRDIRFKCYQKLNSNILLGHILDDVIENIWTNLSHGTDLFYLKKMYDFSIIDNVNLLRPLLETDKELIKQYAKLANIPYTKNTTPEWSNRGKMRNKFIPLTKEMWGDDVDNQILYVSDTLQEYGNYLNKNLFEPFHNGWIKDGNDYINFIDDDIKLMGVNFWCLVINKLFLEIINEETPSRKSIIHITKNMKNGKYPLKKGWLFEIKEIDEKIRIRILKE
jgi:tRNA(Ile)-lysidine synthetase-like protein